MKKKKTFKFWFVMYILLKLILKNWLSKFRNKTENFMCASEKKNRLIYFKKLRNKFLIITLYREEKKNQTQIDIKQKLYFVLCLHWMIDWRL